MMAKKYLIKKSFAYLNKEGQKVYVRIWNKNGDNLFILNTDGSKQRNVTELPIEAVKVGRKCRAIEEEYEE